MKILRIKVIDGIPCIVLEDRIFRDEEKLKKKPKKLILPGYFTDFQQSKEKAHYSKVLEELKRKFKDK